MNGSHISSATRNQQLVTLIQGVLESKDIGSFRKKVEDIMEYYDNYSGEKISFNDYRSLREDLRQAYDSRTLERGLYYIRRLKKSQKNAETTG